jgi:hypothetical protein
MRKLITYVGLDVHNPGLFNALSFGGPGRVSPKCHALMQIAP